ncbi:MAG: hypothetical protein RLZZ549_1047, partial [Pseudomonadota bacterium]
MNSAPESPISFEYPQQNAAGATCVAQAWAKVPVHLPATEKANAIARIKQLLIEKDAVLVAPGFGERGIEGKIETVRYVRENKIPFFGICLGMQMSVIEYSRNVLGLSDANSTEMNDTTSNPVVNLMEEQKTVTDKGGTMRLGAWNCDIKAGTLAHKIYGTTSILERHRHRYEFNSAYVSQLEKAGLKASG